MKSNWREKSYSLNNKLATNNNINQSIKLSMSILDLCSISTTAGNNYSKTSVITNPRAHTSCRDAELQ